MFFSLPPSDAAPADTIIGRDAVDQSPTTPSAGVSKILTPDLTRAPVTPHQVQLPPEG